MTHKIIAVDFDGCLCENAWPRIGAPNWRTIAEVFREQIDGAKIILWTCRSGDRLTEAVDWCAGHGIYFDAVNDNTEEAKELFGGDSRKVFAHEYWDDKAVRKPA